MKPVSPAPQMDSWCVCVTAEHARRSHAARERSASPPSKWTAVAVEKKGWSLSTAASTVWRKPSYTAPLLRPPVRRSSAARRTCATATSADTLSCRCFPQVGGSEGTDGVAVVCSQTEIHLFVPLFPCLRPLKMSQKVSQYGTVLRPWLSSCSAQWWFWLCCLSYPCWPAGGSITAVCSGCRNSTPSREP